LRSDLAYPQPTQRMSRARFLRFVSIAALLALIVVTAAWELALAPLRPGGSWLALKGAPLLFAVRGIVRGHTYTYRWTTMLVLAYFAEGCVRAYSEGPPASVLAVIEIALTATLFVAAIAYIRSNKKV
jgi:uncharacterized membrane protein